MKNLVIFSLLSVIATAASSASTFARSVRPWKYEAKLSEFQVSPGMSTRYMGGTVRVDYLNQKVYLNLTYVPACNPGQACPKYLGFHRREVAIVDVTQDGCGSTIIRAMEDKRPVDGALVEIEIQDHTTRTCEDYRPFMTQVEEKTTSTNMLTGISGTSESNYAGEALRPVTDR